MIARLARALALALAAALPAQAAVLYKSVSPTGTIMFSDTPPPAEAKVLEERLIPDRGASAPAPVNAPAAGALGPTPALAGSDGMPIYQSVEFDAAVARANAQVDAAEKALALARRGTWQPVEGLRLGGPSRRSGDEDRVEFYRKELLAARKELIQLVRDRQHAAARWEARQRERQAQQMVVSR